MSDLKTKEEPRTKMTSQQLKLPLVTLDVFTSQRYLGNPLAVVFLPASLQSTITQETKQRIAREFNLSETVFLHTQDDESTQEEGVVAKPSQVKIDIFTTNEELPFAGHPTIGSAYLVLKHLGWGHVQSLLTKAGPIQLNSTTGDGNVSAKIPHAVHIHQKTLNDILTVGDIAPEAAESIKAALSNNPETRAAELSAPVVSIVRGMTFVLVRLPSLAHLAEVSTSKSLDFNLAKGLLDQGEWEDSFVSRYYYVLQDENEGSGEYKIRSRMVEIPSEDPATGSAACTLASYLAIGGGLGRKTEQWDELDFRFEITQGVEMGRKSDIFVGATVEKESETGEVKVKDIKLGGTAVVVMEGSLLV
ncbi:hypothetical protein V8F20_002296 [Naviculisporaceae sp. PSN 640]